MHSIPRHSHLTAEDQAGKAGPLFRPVRPLALGDPHWRRAMRSAIFVLSALALLSLGACAGMYVAGDAGGGQADHRIFAGR
jgi:hypothetical protein